MNRRLSWVLWFVVISQGVLCQPKKLVIMIGVDWEGMHLKEPNILAMEGFRKKFPGIPLIHFLNPAYFTKARDHQHEDLKRRIMRTVHPGDEHALHLHAWRSFVEDAGVPFRQGPRWDTSFLEGLCLADCGYSVPLHVYNEEELAALLQRAKTILIAQGFQEPMSFRAGGWMANEKVLRVLAREGFLADSSELPSSFLKGPEYRKVQSWVRELWPKASPLSQPYHHQYETTGIREYPNNGGMLDYLDKGDLIKLFKKQLSLCKKDDPRSRTFSLGFHQETAERFLPLLEDFMSELYEYARETKTEVQFSTYECLRRNESCMVL